MIVLLWTICIILGFLVFVMIVGMNIYNRISNRFNNVERAWVAVIAQEKLKNKNIPGLEKAIEEYGLHETQLLKQITDLKVSLMRLEPGKVDLNKLADTEIKTVALLDNLYAVLEKSPELKAMQLFDGVMKDIALHEEEISAAITVFNHNIERFNNGLDVFPDAIVNKHFNKKAKLKTFKDAQAEGAFKYSPTTGL